MGAAPRVWAGSGSRAYTTTDEDLASAVSMMRRAGDARGRKKKRRAARAAKGATSLAQLELDGVLSRASALPRRDPSEVAAEKQKRKQAPRRTARKATGSAEGAPEAVEAAGGDAVAAPAPPPPAVSPPPPLPPVDAALSWEERARAAKTELFGVESDFRPLQWRAIEGAMQGRDVLAVMATGGGKSLVYQVPAVLDMPAVTLVVSPLLALIHDQVGRLREAGVSVGTLHSAASRVETRKLLHALRTGEDAPAVLFVTPERVSKNKAFGELVREMHQRGAIARIVVDEAHCVTEWGVFRPDYQKLKVLRELCPGVPVLAMTGTATPSMRKSIATLLGMERPVLVVGSQNRPNLRYDAVRRGTHDSADELVARFIHTHHRGDTGIVYCLTKRDAEATARFLAKRGVRTAAYHAGMPLSKRVGVQNGWMAGKFDVICSSVAFGMGIDHAHVRFVAHTAPPLSMESYIQQTGRAGRDGDKASCFIVFSPKDFARARHVLGRGQSSALGQRDKIDDVFSFCMGKLCRRGAILRHLGEPNWRASICLSARHAGHSVELCDVCAAERLKHIM